MKDLFTQLIHDKIAITILITSCIILIYIIYTLIWCQYVIYRLNKTDDNYVGNQFVNWQEKQRAKKYHKYYMTEVARREAIYPPQFPAEKSSSVYYKKYF